MSDFLPVLSQSNSLTTARYEYTAIQKRCIYGIISEVRRIYVDRDLRPGEAVQGNLFSDMQVTFTQEMLCKMGENVREVYKSFRGLGERPVEIFKKDGGWEILYWAPYSKYDPKTKTYTVRVLKELLPYVVELAREFTSYSLTVAITLKSSYSQRFYELCCQYRSSKRFFLEIEKLRVMMKLDDKQCYESYGQIKRRIIDVAQRELKDLYEKAQCDLYFDYEVKDKEGKKVMSLWFTIHDREAEKQAKLDYDAIMYELRRLLTTYIKRDAKFITHAMNEFKLRPDDARRALDRFYEIEKDYERKDIAPLFRFVMKNDYNISK